MTKPHKLLDTKELKLIHFWLMAAEIVCADESDPEAPGQMTVKMNVVLQTERQAVPQAKLAQGQQMAQAMFVRQAGGVLPAGVKIVDVFTVGISHLGRMTREEFMEPQQGTASIGRPSNTLLV